MRTPSEIPHSRPLSLEATLVTSLVSTISVARAHFVPPHAVAYVHRLAPALQPVGEGYKPTTVLVSIILLYSVVLASSIDIPLGLDKISISVICMIMIMNGIMLRRRTCGSRPRWDGGAYGRVFVKLVAGGARLPIIELRMQRLHLIMINDQ